MLEDQPIEGSETFETWTVDEMSKKVLYNLCVKTIHKEALKERQPLKWTRSFGPNFPLREQWRSLYKFPLEKRSGDLQWRLINGAISTNRYASHLNPAVTVEGSVSFVVKKRLWKIFFLNCIRLEELFKVLMEWFKSFGETFSERVFIGGVKYRMSKKQKQSGLLNYVLGTAKL